MLLWLADFLSQYSTGFQVFQYLTLRAALGICAHYPFAAQLFVCREARKNSR
jgi:hypothetical protein